MKKIISRKILLVISVVIVLYFLAIYLINLYKIDFVLIGVLRELLTLPMLFAQLFFLFFGIYLLFKEEKKHRTMVWISVMLLASCSIVTIGSFF